MNYAKSTTGNQVPSTVVINQMEGDRQVSITFTAGASDVNNLKILPSAVSSISANFQTQTGVTITAPDISTFSMALYHAFFGLSVYAIKAIRISTTDVANLTGSLRYTKTQIDGQSETVNKNLSAYRVNVGNGYSDEIAVPEWLLVKDLKSELTLSKLKASTSITITFTIDAVADAHNFVPLGAQVIR